MVGAYRAATLGALLLSVTGSVIGSLAVTGCESPTLAFQAEVYGAVLDSEPYNELDPALVWHATGRADWFVESSDWESDSAAIPGISEDAYEALLKVDTSTEALATPIRSGAEVRMVEDLDELPVVRFSAIGFDRGRENAVLASILRTECLCATEHLCDCGFLWLHAARRTDQGTWSVLGSDFEGHLESDRPTGW